MSETGILTDADRDHLVAHAVDGDWLDAHPGAAFSYDADTEFPEGLQWVRAREDASSTGLVFIWTQADGTAIWQLNPHTPPTDSTGRPMKYIGPRRPDAEGDAEVADAPGVLSYGIIADTGRRLHPVWLVEGTKQSRAAAAALAARPSGAGYATVIGIPGIDSWTRGVPVELFARFRGREVIVIPDADARTNARVYAASELLGKNVKGAGARSVRFVQLPVTGTEGLDDYLAGHPRERRGRELETLGEYAISAPAPVKPRAKTTNAPARAGADGTRRALLLTEPYWADGAIRPDYLARAAMEQYHLIQGVRSPVAMYSKQGVYLDDLSPLCTVVRLTLLDDQTPGRVQAVEDQCRSYAEVRGVVLPDGLMPEPLVNVRNGMVDLHTGQLLPHDPKYRSSIQLPIEYDPAATCPLYDEWIIDRAGPEQAAVIDAIGRQMIDPSAMPRFALMLVGPPRTAKSMLLKLLTEIAGPERTSSVALQQLHREHYSVNLYGKLLNSCADLPGADTDDLGVFKQLTGGDQIQANPKNKDMFGFRNTATLAFSSNEIPSLPEGGAAFARMIPVAFVKSFLGSEDMTLEARLLAEMSGIFNRFVRHPGTPPVPHPEVVETFRSGADRVARFVASVTVPCTTETALDADGRPPHLGLWTTPARPDQPR